MYKPIIPGEVLIEHDPLEPICIPESPRDHPWRRRALYATAGYLAFVAVDNVRLYQDELLSFYQDGDMIENAGKCDPFPLISLDAEDGARVPFWFSIEKVAATKKVEDDFSDTLSAARQFKTKNLDLVESALELYEINKNEFDSFISKYSGMDVHLYSNSPNPFPYIDTDSVDTLIHASLDPRIAYDHIGVQAFIDCARELILLSEGGSLLEGERVNIFIPDRPGVCWKNGLVQEIPPKTPYRDFCESVGATFKDVRFAIWPFYKYEQTWMALMTHRSTEDEANYRTSRMFIHEPQHLIMQYLELPFKIDPNEALADYITENVIEQLYPDSLPTTIHYDPQFFDEILRPK